MNGTDPYLTLLERLDCLSNQISDMQAWNRDLQAQLDQQAVCIRANNTAIADLGQWVSEVAGDMLDRTDRLGRRLALVS